ncbi:hypothetical protein LCGC14_1924050 [marine sediment metagenome]|uniref:Uncharacterized protein n=1 Tax=marine sediment metagenome TaxID=412755 RepID=A0A0F9IMQ8_9ZZZZ
MTRWRRWTSYQAWRTKDARNVVLTAAQISLLAGYPELLVPLIEGRPDDALIRECDLPVELLLLLRQGHVI